MMQPVEYSAITTDPVSPQGISAQDCSLFVLRLDKIHPVISGNKIFKLGEYLDEAIRLGKTHIQTYGGAWSNHIVAAAAACKAKGLGCTGYIRGEAPPTLPATLQEAAGYGMQLIFLDRETFRRQKRNARPTGDDAYVIPEGGFGPAGARGAATIPDHYGAEAYTHICCAAGTGTMAAGLALNQRAGEQVIAVSALKNHLQLADDIRSLTGELASPPELVHDYHFGGFAKYNQELIRFINRFYESTGIPSDFVYTGKLFFAIADLLQQHYFPAGSRILMIHSGGLQGNASLSKDTLIF